VELAVLVQNAVDAAHCCHHGIASIFVEDCVLIHDLDHVLHFDPNLFENVEVVDNSMAPQPANLDKLEALTSVFDLPQERSWDRSTAANDHRTMRILASDLSGS